MSDRNLQVVELNKSNKDERISVDTYYSYHNILQKNSTLMSDGPDFFSQDYKRYLSMFLFFEYSLDLLTVQSIIPCPVFNNQIDNSPILLQL